jgi:carboxyl-terminal processing protease
MKTRYFIYLLFSVLTLSVLTPSCKKDKQSGKVTKIPYVQQWIYNNMQYWYYWTSQMTTKPDYSLAPDKFFYSLLFTGTGGDRFSWIEPDYTVLQNYLNGVTLEAGYDFRLYLASSTSSNVIGQITYIKKGSPAEAAGLKRGDIFTKINGTQMTTSNYSTLLSATNSAYTLQVQRYDPDTQAQLWDKLFNLGVVELADNPVFMDSVYTFNTSGKTVGYLVYNFFSPGLDTTAAYDKQVDAVFGKFKASGVNELVLDLRFNGGGAISSAINLASLLVPGYTVSKNFVNFQYNTQVQSDILAEPTLGSSYLHQNFIAKASNIGNSLSRLYVLTSGGTASASELIINGLRPYMNVILVGDTTYGKNVGSITITDTDSTSNKWGLQPIVLKLTNSLGQSDYTKGFAPDYLNLDNSFYLRPLGDIQEALLNKALLVITNNTLKKTQTLKAMASKSIGSPVTLDSRKSSMYITQKQLPIKKLRIH